MFLLNNEKKWLVFLCLLPFHLFGQADTVYFSNDINPVVADKAATCFPASTSYEIVQRKPFSFLSSIPGDIYHTARSPFLKKGIKPFIIVAGITAILMTVDQPVADHVRHFADRICLNREVKFKEFVKVSGRGIGIKVPRNINSALYQLGEEPPALLLAGGLFIYGKLTTDQRATKTAGDITESMLASGIVVQILKRITGRQKPSSAELRGGKWHPFPSLHAYSKNESNYASFPSGHMATMMAAITAMAENYPEKKWIRPVGYSLMTLTALAMINNNSHWISDYPLGIAIGYLSGKIAAHRQGHKKIKENVSY
jgi:hypothetical protein